MNRTLIALLVAAVALSACGAPESTGEKAYNAYLRKKRGPVYDGAEKRFLWSNLSPADQAAWEAAAEAAMTSCEGGR